MTAASRPSAPLAARVRALLPPDAPRREVPMFGGLSFMVHEKMVASVRGDDEMLLRIDPARSEELLALDGARPAEMGAGRAMGPAWILVDHGALDTDERLAFWLGVALDHNERARRGPAGEDR